MEACRQCLNQHRLKVENLIVLPERSGKPEGGASGEEGGGEWVEEHKETVER